MNTFMKTSCVAALALAMTTFGASQARAGGWAVAGGVVGGLAVGTAVGVTVASAAAPVYYAAPVYGAPGYYAPGAAVTVAAPYYCAPRLAYAAPYPYFHPYFHPYARVGYGWGPRHYYGGRYYRR
jgi:hypothetical protein